LACCPGGCRCAVALHEAYRQITIHVASDLKDVLQRAAKGEDRNVAYIIERILRAHFEREAFQAEARGHKRK
jgi:predicted transcriptional regulator